MPSEKQLEKIVEITLRGDDYLTSGDQPNAQKEYKKALAIVYELKEHDTIITADLYRKMGDSLRDEGKIEEAITQYEGAIEIYKKLNRDQDIFMIYGNIYYVLKELNLAEASYKEALALEKKPEERAELYRKLGDVYREGGKHKESIEAYQKDLSLSKTPIAQASTLRKLGIIFHESGDLKQAEESFVKALALRREHSINSMHLVNILNRMGAFYFDTDRIQEAIQYLEEAKAIIKVHYKDLDNRYMSFTLKWLDKCQTRSDLVEKKQGRLGLFLGLPGSGKTTLSENLGEKYPECVPIQKDLACSVLLGKEPYFGKFYNEYAGPKSYESILAHAKNLLKFKNKIVLPDGFFIGKLKTLDLISPSFKTPIIYLHCSGDEQYKRLLERNTLDRDADKIKDKKTFIAYRIQEIRKVLQCLSGVPREELLMVDTENKKEIAAISEKAYQYFQTSKGLSRLLPEKNLSQFEISEEEAMSDYKGFCSLLERMYAYEPNPRVEDSKSSKLSEAGVEGLKSQNVFAKSKSSSDLIPKDAPVSSPMMLQPWS